MPDYYGAIPIALYTRILTFDLKCGGLLTALIYLKPDVPISWIINKIVSTLHM